MSDDPAKLGQARRYLGGAAAPGLQLLQLLLDLPHFVSHLLLSTLRWGKGEKRKKRPSHFLCFITSSQLRHVEQIKKLKSTRFVSGPPVFNQFQRLSHWIPTI